MSGFRTYPRGAHMSGRMLQLEHMGVGVPAAAFQPLEPPAFRRDFLSPLSPTSERVEDFAPAFANLTVWTEAAARGAAFHAGYDKIKLYAAFLRSVVDELLPAEELRRRVCQLEEYLAYLTSEDVDDTRDGKKPKDGALSARSPRRSYVHVKMPPVDRHRPMAALLSPRALRAIQYNPAAAQHGVSKRALSPPRKSQKRLQQHERPPKTLRLVGLSDHEEAILELALYFEESVPLLVLRDSGIGNCATSSIAPPLPSTPRTPGLPWPVSLTERWLLLTSDAKRQTLKRIKRKLAQHEFFVSPAWTRAAAKTASDRRTPSRSSRHESAADGVTQVEADRPTGYRRHKLLLSPYFSLVMLCLHETLRRVGGLTQELAHFACKVLCEDTLTEFEHMFAEITEQQVQAQQELQALKDSKAVLQHDIRQVESEIQRLQTQNTRSLDVWNLESEEMGHLEQEARWHGHCKALILNCLRHVQTEARTPAWLLLPSTSSTSESTSGGHAAQTVTAEGGEESVDGAEQGAEEDGGDHSDRDVEEKDEGAAGGHLEVAGEDSKCDTTPRVAEPSEEGTEDVAQTPCYQQLSSGAALVHDRARAQLVYIAHLIILCRSFLHLHERRAVQDVMNSTALEHSATTGTSGLGLQDGETSSRQPRQSQPRESAAASKVVDSTTTTNPMGVISLSELHTLREINEALRAIEVLYAETGAVHGKQTTNPNNASDQGGTSRDFRRPPCQHRAIGTQFPVAGGPTPARSFLRALAYCTMAATGISRDVAFLPVGAAASASKPAIEASAVSDDPTEATRGSGRRRGSVSFHASEPKEKESASTRPLLRLHKAFPRLPAHMKRILLLPVLADNPFPPSSAFAVAPSLSKDEMVQKIHAIYAVVVENVYGLSTATASAPDRLPISLSKPSRPWTSDTFVEFILAYFLDTARGDVGASECEFVRFFASLQLFLSRELSSSVGGGVSTGSSATQSLARSDAAFASANETLQFFAVLTKLHQLGTNHVQPPVCTRAFHVFFYCQRVLAHVTIQKKRLHGGADLGTDVWVVASDTSANVSNGVTCGQPQFVLLEAVRTLVLHLVPSSSASTPVASEAERTASLELHLEQLEERAVTAIVALITPVTPGEYYGLPGSQATEATSGELTETRILPLDVAASMVVKAWMAQQELIERKMATAFQAAVTDDCGRLSFSEFAHVMSMGSGQTPPSAVVGSAFASPFGATAVPELLPPARLAQMYATAKVGGSNDPQASLHGVPWPNLLRAVMRELDFLGLEERAVHLDFRSIQGALATRLGHRSSHVRHLLSWLTGASSRVGTPAALRKTWGRHRKAMDESFELAFQADNALEGVRWGQSGRLRYNKMQNLFPPDTSTNQSAPTKPLRARGQSTGETRAESTRTATLSHVDPPSRGNAKTKDGDEQEELGHCHPEVAWKAFQYLQSDYSAASLFADKVRLKQQQQQRTQTSRGR